MKSSAVHLSRWLASYRILSIAPAGNSSFEVRKFSEISIFIPERKVFFQSIEPYSSPQNRKKFTGAFNKIQFLSLALFSCEDRGSSGSFSGKIAFPNLQLLRNSIEVHKSCSSLKLYSRSESKVPSLKFRR